MNTYPRQSRIKG